MKTLKFKLYQHKRNRYLKQTINAAGVIYNYAIALHKRYYRMWGKHLSCAKLQSHIAKLRKRKEFWQLVGSQAVQDICQRIEKAYQLFFKHHNKGVKPPSFKKVKKYKSFTLKQAGYKFLDGNRVRIGNRVYQYWKSREIEGTVKTLTVKRTPLGELFMVMVVDDVVKPQVKFTTGACSKAYRRLPPVKLASVAGFDFGLRTFLTCFDGTKIEKIESPQFFKQLLNSIQKASKQLARKLKGSANRERARKNLARRYEDIANRRHEEFWKLAISLTNRFDVLCFETLNLKGKQRLWGRKVSDLAFGARKLFRRRTAESNCCERFLQILEWVALKKGKQVVYVDRWYPSSKTCSNCGHILSSLDLKVREWRCPCCQSVNGRDENAAKNIQMVGASTIRLGGVRRTLSAATV